MGFILFLAGAMVLAVALLPWTRPEGGLPERIGLAVLLWFSILIGTNWGLALLRLFTEEALWLCLAGYLLVGTGLLILGGRKPRPSWSPFSFPPLALLVLAALGISILYIIVRGSLVPPTEFDALSYHFPKAVEVTRAHGVAFIPSGDFRIPYFPWDYELMLADGLLLARSDQQSYWIGLMATFGFGAYACAILKRAWPHASSTEVLLGLVFVLASPVVILHAGAYKNDVLFSFFLLSAIHWMTLWSQRGGKQKWTLALVSLALGLGTKSTALFLLPVVGVAAWRFRAKWPFGGPRQVWHLALGVAGLGLLLVLTGAAWPILNQIWCGHFLGETAVVGGVSGFQSNAVPQYTGLANLWQFPLLAILRPFSSNPLGVWVFWKHQYWYWPAYNCIYSHFGWLCSVLLLLLPVGVVAHRATRGEWAGYRLTLTCVILGFIALSLPQSYRVDGMFCTFPRYLLCIPVLVSLWAVVPTLIRLRGKGKVMGMWGAGVGLVAYFLAQSFLCFKYDASKPYDFVEQCLDQPGVRPDMGVENALDRVAGPLDPVAFDSGYGAFVYPLYGVALTRPLVYLPRPAGSSVIPPGVKWVVIDRKWNVGWSHPGATTTADFFLPMKRGASQEDLALVAQLTRDPEFALVYSDPGTNQWIFVARKFMVGAKS